ncbi:hypothetical protein MMC30_005479 [Trapelia coarctata]|nr:hypothetical protein [Trapelia coarctata]
MKRFAGLLTRRDSSAGTESATGDSPEASVARGVRLFCESGGPNNSGEEVLHLPVIVEAAESSPAAAREAANVIRKFLGKENYSRAYVQYNAIMVIRILADNPGESFTRNLGGKFVVTTKELLRDGRDVSVQQILRETLDTFQLQKSQDEGLQALITMWQNEKAKLAKRGASYVAPVPGSRTMNAPLFHPSQQNPNYFARSHGRHGLPPPHELASRIEEAKTSAKLLLQVAQSTPPNEVLGNELLKEFSERCQSASRSIQGYINSDNPAPDEDTLLTLIETNDQLSAAMSKYQRALLQARKALGAATPSPPAMPPRAPPPENSFGPNLSAPPPQNPYAPPTQIPLTLVPGAGPPSMDAYAVPPPGPPPRLTMPRRQETPENPFDDSNQTSQQTIVNGTSAPRASTPQGSLQPNPYEYKPTPSYLGRQESSANNLTMHGAGTEQHDGDVSPEEVRRPVQYRF